MDFRYQQEDVVAKILKDSIIYNEGTFTLILNNICRHIKTINEFYVKIPYSSVYSTYIMFILLHVYILIH